jgi:hypothetical protein
MEDETFWLIAGIPVWTAMILGVPAPFLFGWIFLFCVINELR